LSIFIAIWDKYKKANYKSKYIEMFGVYCSILPWVLLAPLQLIRIRQEYEAIFTNTGLIILTIFFIRRNIKQNIQEYSTLNNLNDELSSLKFTETEESEESEESKKDKFINKFIFFDFSTREKDVIMKIREGKSNKIIADDLFISERTVNKHIQNIYQKANVSNRIELMNIIHNVQL